MSKIVVIDDNYQSARLAAKLLQKTGHEVIVAEDGESGLVTACTEIPDLILLDLGLPDIDGQTMIPMLRQHTELQQIPIIAYTAWPEDTAVDMAHAYGCDGVIVKPIDTRKFPDQVSVYLTAN